MLSTNEVTQVLSALKGCADLTCGNCLRCRVRSALQGKPPEQHAVTISSLLAAKNQEGRVEIIVNSERMQMAVSKAREIYEILGGAIEAAISDEAIWKLLKAKDLTDAECGAFLLEFREARQGTKGTVYAS